MNHPWDNLIVLDACRFDFFRRYNSIKGRLYRMVTRGTVTNDWLKASFPGFYSDTIYVSANSHVSTHDVQGWRGSEHFAYVEEVHSYAWDEAIGTVHPKDVVSAALRVRTCFPGFRMIVHFMQPHGPYIGQTYFSPDLLPAYFDGRSLDWVSLRKAYRDNLLLVLRETQRLVEGMEGTTVITSDHGELLGEYFLVMHWRWLYLKELAFVPWLVVDSREQVR
jgi:hypothetical protein